jgi:hypothetical protein
MKNVYLIKHWAAVVLIAPVLVVLSGMFMESSEMHLKEALEWYFLFALFGCFFSVPTLAINYFVLFALKNKSISTFYLKLIEVLITIGGIQLTMYLLGGRGTFQLGLTYSINDLLTAFFIKMD